MVSPGIGRRSGRRPKRFASLEEGARRRGRRLASLALATAELGGLAALLLAPSFTVRSIEVSGNTRLTNDQVLSAAGPISGSVFLVDPRALERRRQTSPWIPSAPVPSQPLDPGGVPA